MVNILLRYSFLNSILKQPLKKRKLTPASVVVRNMNAVVPLDSIPKVEIDGTGVFKYILMKVYDKTDDEKKIIILRGYFRCCYHSDIYEEVQEKLYPLECDPMGGGRISHNAERKVLRIYGYSQGYGKGDHELAAKLIKEAYPEYKITISDEGY